MYLEYSMKKILLNLLIFFLILDLASSEDSGVSFPSEFIREEFSETKTDSYGGKTNHEGIMPSEESLVEISRKIMSPAREDAYFLDDTIVVLVKMTSLKKDGLNNIEIWEMPGFDLKIINCSYPLKTTSIEYILDYEIYEKSELRKEDVNFTGISKHLSNHSVPIYSHIYNLLSSETQSILNNDSTHPKNFSKYILKDLNKIIEKENLYLNRSLFLKSNISYRRDNVFQSKPNSSYEDNKLVNRRLLEDAFPGLIKRSPFSLNKKHESLGVYKSHNAIKYNETELKNRETIIFKYYLKPTKLGNTEIRSIIRSDGFFKEDSTPIKIIERDPKFEYELFYESKDLYLNKPYDFIYSIKYLGGDEEEKNFSINISVPESCRILKKGIQGIGGQETIDDNETMNITLAKGITKKIFINVVFSEDGSKLSPPRISINNVPKEVEADISVYSGINWTAKRNYEFASIFFGIISSVLGIISFYEAFIIHQERNKTSNLMKNNNDALAKLDTLIDKKLK